MRSAGVGLEVGKFQTQARLGETGSWFYGKEHKTNKCGAVYFYNVMNVGRSQTDTMRRHETKGRAFAANVKGALLKFTPFSYPAFFPALE